VLVLLGIGGLLLLSLSFVVEVRIVVESPALGDVTGIVQLLWNVILGIATLGSFALAVYNYQQDTDSCPPPIRFSVKGRNHDIDFHLHMDDSEDITESAYQEPDGEGGIDRDSESEDESEDEEEAS